MPFRVKFGALHLACSLTAAALVWLLVFTLWFPAPFSELAGGKALFLILVSVDVVLGPALTTVVAGPHKPRAELRRDVAVIVLLQLAALAYGLHTMAQARPVAVAFEVDLLRVVTATEVDADTLGEAPPALRHLPWTGPVQIAVVKPTDAAEQLRTIELGLAGVPLAALPRYWREVPPYRASMWAAARPLPDLLARRPALAAQAAEVARQAGVPAAGLRTLPLLARRGELTAVIAAPDARIVGYLPGS